ncbi:MULTISPECIES: GtrA family protein [Klebsiella]|nr:MULTISPECIES: GtrA family protein [Klebsiella]EJU32011.1 GtrA-like protein [Klebsiella sp. OBRC7]EKV7895971.1 GtrA family protein [Klebsiella michiganensis]ELB7344252.1 GtrA family protein [Klebsiella michiganensis]ELC0837795.1 GtrA family protein [Klebsiella michiganensis]ELC2233272.1 GtrA family protein [Klebsiella michiganensis]
MINHTLKKNTSREAVRYIIVGLANTAMTAVVIFGLMHAGVGIYPSNATGYVVGIIFSFVMNAKFTFSTTLSPLRFIKFVSTCAFCYILNLIAMKVFFIVIPDAIYTAQVVGMIIYTTAGFIINKYWSMK